MKISCECYLPNLLPADVEQELSDRNPTGLCEICREELATEICTINSLREFVTSELACSVCTTCHQNIHAAAYENIGKQASTLNEGINNGRK